jgi:hypothetical protein
MQIITPTEIEHVAWEGYLVPSGQVFRGARPTPRVTLGEPVWWPAEEAMQSETGKQWTSPSGGRRYTLLRLVCTLHPPDDPRTRYAEATLSVYLRPRHDVGPVVAHDLYPQRLTAESQGKISVALKPDLKFAEVVKVSLLEAGVEIEHHNVFPVIQAFGLGESRPYWQFAHHAANPLLGCQSVYAVLDAPGDAGGVRLSLELTATLETRYGPLRAGLPEEAQVHLSRTIS